MSHLSERTPFERWASCPGRPCDWLHHKALTRNRLASIDRLFPPLWRGRSPTAPKATIAEWLKALIKDQEAHNAILASRAAVQTTATIPIEIRSNEALGEIVLTASGDWRSPDSENVFLLDETLVESFPMSTESYVHPELLSDSDTFSALKKLGLKPPSFASAFQHLVARIFKTRNCRGFDSDLHKRFWMLSRELQLEKVHAVIRTHTSFCGVKRWPSKLRVRTLSGKWRLFHSVLLPGAIVPDDGSRDGEATVDTKFHKLDQELLRSLGVTEMPYDGCNLSFEANFKSFLSLHRKRYAEQDNLPHNPDRRYLDFTSTKGVGPLEILAVLSTEGNSLYTDALLNLDASFETWTMHHTGTTSRGYPKMPCESLTIHMLRKHGSIRTPSGIVPLADALGSYPKSLAALHQLFVNQRLRRSKQLLIC